MADKLGPIKIEDARIVFRNFSGAEGQYNRAGDRNFAVVLDHPTAEKLMEDGWNIKYFKVREDDEDAEEPLPYIPVSVSYKNRPPSVTMLTSVGRTRLNEESIETLDWVDIAHVDVILNPYQWLVSGKSGVKAYLKTMFVTIDEDDLERKYANYDVTLEE